MCVPKGGRHRAVYYMVLLRFGRYLSEVFRAARLVVDTGIHAYGSVNYVIYQPSSFYDVKRYK